MIWTARFAAVAALTLAAAPALADGAARAAPSEGPEGERRWMFHVDWGPVKLADVEIRVTAEDGRVELAGAGRSVGLAAMVADFEVSQRSVYVDGRRRYEATARWDDRDSRRRVRWDGAPQDGARPSVEVASTDPRPLTPIPSEALAGTVDPAFPVWDTLRRIERGGDCGARYAVYDGVRRFDLILEDRGRETLERDRDWTWGGEARVCRLKFERVGGFPEDAERETEESEYERLLYIGEVDGAPTPVRLRVQWPLGYATARIELN